MKRIGALVCLSALIVMFSATFCFGADLSVEKTYPKDQQTNTSIENLGVKVYLNDSITSDASKKANADCFQIVDDKGEAIPVRVLYHPKEKGLVMVLADNTKIDANKKLSIKENTTYSMKISGDFVSDSGKTLGEEYKITFTTLNQSKTNTINMGMMGVMFAAIFIFSSRSLKKQAAKQEVQKKQAPVNPYKESKKTGKSVEEIVEKTEKQKAKDAKKKAKRKAEATTADVVDDADDYEDNDNYRVKSPRPISAGGSTYITGRKALAEKKAAEEARKAKYAAQNKGKGKKKK